MRVRAQLKIEVNAAKSRWISCWHKRILLTSSRNFCRSRLALESLRTLHTQFENGILSNGIKVLMLGDLKLMNQIYDSGQPSSCSSGWSMQSLNSNSNENNRERCHNFCCIAMHAQRQSNTLRQGWCRLPGHIRLYGSVWVSS